MRFFSLRIAAVLVLMAAATSTGCKSGGYSWTPSWMKWGSASTPSKSAEGLAISKPSTQIPPSGGTYAQSSSGTQTPPAGYGQPGYAATQPSYGGAYSQQAPYSAQPAGYQQPGASAVGQYNMTSGGGYQNPYPPAGGAYNAAPYGDTQTADQRNMYPTTGGYVPAGGYAPAGGAAPGGSAPAGGYNNVPQGGYYNPQPATGGGYPTSSTETGSGDVQQVSGEMPVDESESSSPATPSGLAPTSGGYRPGTTGASYGDTQYR